MENPNIGKKKCQTHIKDTQYILLSFSKEVYHKKQYILKKMNFLFNCECDILQFLFGWKYLCCHVLLRTPICEVKDLKALAHITICITVMIAYAIKYTTSNSCYCYQVKPIIKKKSKAYKQTVPSSPSEKDYNTTLITKLHLVFLHKIYFAVKH